MWPFKKKRPQGGGRDFDEFDQAMAQLRRQQRELEIKVERQKVRDLNTQLRMSNSRVNPGENRSRAKDLVHEIRELKAAAEELGLIGGDSGDTNQDTEMLKMLLPMLLPKQAPVPQEIVQAVNKTQLDAPEPHYNEGKSSGVAQRPKISAQEIAAAVPKAWRDKIKKGVVPKAAAKIWAKREFPDYSEKLFEQVWKLLRGA